MASKIQSDSDPKRTIWTPEMTKYFIELLLEQLNKGTRFDDRISSKRAWREMISLFNERFEAAYRKVVLKNRYKYLKNIHNKVKIILNHQGFFWDESRQIVTADTSVWEEYIKPYPEAHIYMVTKIPYFGDLDIIFENKSIENKGNELPASSSSTYLRQKEIVGSGTEKAAEENAEDINDITMDDYMPNDDDCDARENANENAPSRTRTPNWKPTEDEYFIQLMTEHTNKGNKVNGKFLKKAWREMIDSFNAKFGSNHNVVILKNRYKTHRRLYNLLKNLLNTEGFAYDETRQTVIADDHLWKDYIKTHPKAQMYMKRPIPHLKDLFVIFSDSSPKKDLETKDDGREPLASDPSVAYQGNDYSSTVVSTTDVVKTIQELPDMDGDLILDACDYLEDDSNARRFMALNGNTLRKKWLLRKLRSQS